MSKLFFVSDLHLGHKAIPKYRPQFTTTEEHDDFIISNYLATVSKRDTIYFLGDVAFSMDAIMRLKVLPGYKILILGNHDTDFGIAHAQALQTCFNRVYGLTTKKGCWLSHAPIHPEELRGKFNIHGHTHNATLQDPRYVNVSLENCNYFPVDFTEIKAALAAGTVFTKL